MSGKLFYAFLWVHHKENTMTSEIEELMKKLAKIIHDESSSLPFIREDISLIDEIIEKRKTPIDNTEEHY